MTTPAGTARRIAFLDQIRGVVILLVVLHHTAITYGGEGSWYYREHVAQLRHDSAAALLTMFCAINQSFFMGLFFLLAGYMTPAAYDRKGALRYLRDRALRLGIPLLLFAYFLDALTNAIAQQPRQHDFVFDLVVNVASLNYAPGPMWFVQTLLVFALAYALLRALRKGGVPLAPSDTAPLPRPRTLLAAALGTGTVAFALRLWFPTGAEVAHLQLGYFASYVLLFVAGCVAWRHRWLERIDWAYARRWWIVTLIAIPVLPLGILALHTWQHGVVGVSGGWNLDALLYAFWEPLVAWGIILALLWYFRAKVNPDRVHGLSRAAYAIYLLHPPVVVAISVALRPWDAPPLLKFVVVGTLSCMAAYILASLLLRIRAVARIL
ncbi:MAG: acyltransferase family protein [Casimicrobiaceae bacterium]